MWQSEKHGRGEESGRTSRSGRPYITSTFNNTTITLTDPNGTVLSWASAGTAGFKGSRKSTPYAARPGRRKRRSPGYGTRPEPGRGSHQRARAAAARPPSALSRLPASGDQHPGRYTHAPQRLPAAKRRRSRVGE